MHGYFKKVHFLYYFNILIIINVNSKPKQISLTFL